MDSSRMVRGGQGAHGAGAGSGLPGPRLVSLDRLLIAVRKACEGWEGTMLSSCCQPPRPGRQGGSVGTPAPTASGAPSSFWRNRVGHGLGRTLLRAVCSACREGPASGVAASACGGKVGGGCGCGGVGAAVVGARGRGNSAGTAAGDREAGAAAGCKVGAGNDDGSPLARSSVPKYWPWPSKELSPLHLAAALLSLLHRVASLLHRMALSSLKRALETTDFSSVAAAALAAPGILPGDVKGTTAAATSGSCGSSSSCFVLCGLFRPPARGKLCCRAC